MTKKRKFLFFIYSVLFLLTASSYYLLISGKLSLLWLPELIYLIFPFLGVVFGWLAVRSFSLKSGHGWSLAFISSGVTSWFIAETIWFTLEYGFGLSPFPSVADFFFIAGYPLIAIGIINELYRRKVLLSLGRIFLLVAVIINFGTFLAITIFNNVSGYDTGVAKVFSLGYGIGDFLMLFVFLFVLFLAREYEGGRLFRPWLLIFCGLSLFFTADLLFAFFGHLYEIKKNTFLVVDFFWITAYSLISGGMADFYLTIAEMNQKIRNQAKNFNN